MSDIPTVDAAVELARPVGHDSMPRIREYVPVEFARQLERENAALRKDKERLDWLERRTVSRLDWVITHVEMNKLPIRDAFDLSIKEVGP